MPTSKYTTSCTVLFYRVLIPQLWTYPCSNHTTSIVLQVVADDLLPMLWCVLTVKLPSEIVNVLKYRFITNRHDSERVNAEGWYC